MPVGILTYANLVLARGRDDFYRRAAEAGVDSVLVADVPLIEAAPFAAAARAHGVEPVLIAAANTPPERLARDRRGSAAATPIASPAPGVTGADEAVRFDHDEMLAALREAGAPPPIFGFGISQARPCPRRARRPARPGVICGSAIVARIAAGEPVAAFVREMKAATLCRAATIG